MTEDAFKLKPPGILNTDVAGYSRLIGEDEGRPAITHFDGNSLSIVNHCIEQAILLNSMWGLSEKDIYAAGYRRGPDIPGILHYGGTSWSVYEGR